MKFLILGTKKCPACHHCKSLMEMFDVPYVYKNLESIYPEDWRQSISELKHILGNHRTLPFIFVESLIPVEHELPEKIQNELDNGEGEGKHWRFIGSKKELENVVKTIDNQDNTDNLTINDDY